MKKLVICICVICFTLLICKPSRSGILDGEVKYHLELGNNCEYHYTHATPFYQEKEAWKYTFIDMKIGYEFKLLYLYHLVYFENKWWSIRSDEFIFIQPFREIYTTGYKTTYRNFFFKFEHFCNHPVNTALGKPNSWVDNHWGESITTLSFGLSNW